METKIIDSKKQDQDKLLKKFELYEIFAYR